MLLHQESGQFCVVLGWVILAVWWGIPACWGAAPQPAAANVANDVLHFSYELERWLDVDKRPCQDFFGYVCGKSLNTTSVQQEQRLQWQQEKFDRFLAADNDDELMDAELKLKHFYESCKNARSLDDLKSSLLYRTSGGWPAIDDSPLMIRKRRNMTWMGVLSAFHDTGVEYFFRHRIEMKSNKRQVMIEPEELNHNTLRKFEQLANDIMQEYNVELGRARLVALEILSFERGRRDIAKKEVPSDVTEFTYADFKTSQFGSAAQADWDAYFKKTLGKPLRATDTVVIKELPRLLEVFEFLRNTTMTRLLNWIWIDYLMDKTNNDCQVLVRTYFEPIYQHIVERAAVNKVQMAQMYSDIGQVYDQLLSTTRWMDEISQQNSKQFLGRIIHLTLNGDAKLDTDHISLTITKRNFYRNMEKAQRFLAQQRQNALLTLGNSLGAAMTQATTDYMKVFLTINSLLQQQNLTTPINYVMVGAHFAEHMIAGGSSSSTPGAWRSMDSEREYATFRQCIARQSGVAASALTYNINDLILKLLAQRQSSQALELWQQKDPTLLKRLNNLLAAGRLQLSLRKLYFVGSLLTDCRQYTSVGRKDLLNRHLRNSPEFTQAFGCRPNEPLYARKVCKIL